MVGIGVDELLEDLDRFLVTLELVERPAVKIKNARTMLRALERLEKFAVDLCGCRVVFYLAQALAVEHHGQFPNLAFPLGGDDEGLVGGFEVLQLHVAAAQIVTAARRFRGVREFLQGGAFCGDRRLVVVEPELTLADAVIGRGDTFVAGMVLDELREGVDRPEVVVESKLALGKVEIFRGVCQ